jgi:hypothetical protein
MIDWIKYSHAKQLHISQDLYQTQGEKSMAKKYSETWQIINPCKQMSDILIQSTKFLF